MSSPGPLYCGPFNFSQPNSSQPNSIPPKIEAIEIKMKFEYMFSQKVNAKWLMESEGGGERKRECEQG